MSLRHSVACATLMLLLGAPVGAAQTTDSVPKAGTHLNHGLVVGLGVGLVTGHVLRLMSSGGTTCLLPDICTPASEVSRTVAYLALPGAAAVLGGIIGLVIPAAQPRVSPAVGGLEMEWTWRP